MRYSRMNGRKPKRNYTNIILFLILIGGVTYLIFATAAGNWLAENVARPVFSAFTGTAQPSASPSGSIQPSASVNPSASPSASAVSGERTSDKITVPAKTFYAIQSGVFDDKQNAQTEADAVKQRGGAGYVYEDNGKYRVLMSVYKTEDEAKTVKDKLLNDEKLSTIVKPIEQKELTFSITATTEQIEGIKDCFTQLHEIEDSLLSVILENDKNTDVKEELTGLLTKINTINTTFTQLTQGSTDNEVLSQLKSVISQNVETLTTLSETYQAQNTQISAKLKEGTFQILVSFTNFVNGLG